MSEATSLLRIRLEIPAPGETTRIRKGALDLTLQNNRAGLCLLTEDAREDATGARHFLGLPRDGHLELEARAPEFRAQVELTDALTLAPGGRLRGYVTVPLPHRLVWRRPNNRAEPLLNVVPKELRTAWTGEGKEGGYVHETRSRFYVDRKEARADVAALVPVILRNIGGAMLSPQRLLVSLRDRDLRELAGRIVAAPRRIVFRAEDVAEERVRPMTRVGEFV